MAWASDRLILYCPRCSCDCGKGLIHASAKKMLLKALLVVSLLFPFCTSIETIEMDQHVKDGDLLVSKENIFALGFFSPRNSSSRYVGIWYVQKDQKDQKVVVWVANRNDPINDTSGVLIIDRYGRLLLYSNNMQNIPVWSANVTVQTASFSCRAQLLDSGNLVIYRDNKTKKFMWQSFDYPTDTLLPGMKLGVNWKLGIEWVLTSWKSQDDPGTGEYTERLYSNHTATPEFFVYKGLTPYWRSDPVDPRKFVSSQDEMYFFLKNDSTSIRSVLKDSGSLQILGWSNADREWKELWSAPKYQCDLYGECGANSKCNPDNINFFGCVCLPGYEPKSVNDWNMRNGSDGCVSKRVAVSKCRNGEGFRKVPQVKDPDTTKAARLEKGISVKECKQVCLSNCSCTAYMVIESEGRSDCLTWYGELLDILVYTQAGRDLHVRVDKIELAENSQNSKGFLKRRGMLAILMLSVLLALVLIVLLACWRIKKKRKTKVETEETRRHPELQFFHLRTIIAATNNFSPVQKLGQGGFGTVYKGVLRNNQNIAVKRLSRTSEQGVEEFKNEVALIARLQHRNLVKLLGCCIKGEERMLVLEYLPNKSLDCFLFDHTKKSLLDWQKRFEIINGVARGVLYLHQDSRLRIIHRDLKTSNVLLDAKMNPKISDFGMARIFHGDQLQDRTNRVVGTYGYMSPEYVVFGRFSTKSDVFSFGVILLEIVSGKKNNSFHQEDHFVNLIGHVWQLWSEDRALEIVDSSLESYAPDEGMRCIQVGLLCVEEESKNRPSMSAVVFMLSGEASAPSPQQPAFSLRKNSSGDAAVPSVSKGSCSINDVTITKFEGR
ncbi:LOW QUALITY PROTEIN: G-type lectin S-receptor-like serine/threonine-protein kinase RKS1 [Pyrus x bretschneideri]|uniref:LOW QUALITY PROTEIN: G-type lectin S-receptor-like serine/threonine-protein kinase RKS1 n=1 Tax=Pyrus x bretschneideri TaxID=225117 RepID=UPI00202E4956|nr:LOW QUALITY PROTEIN: G-type lectin S-receptor-like serine/threonine-protein kinase RKS1 [Pyrus x bretschneideri]